MIPPAPTAPACSVIVPVYRQWNEFACFLECWAGQPGLPGAVELICVNNEPGRPAPPGLPIGLRVVDCDAPGSYAARNAGAAAATGRWLVFTDADCRPQREWLSALMAAMADTPGMLLAGDVRMILDGAPTPWSRFDLVRGIPQARYVSRGYAATANLAVPAGLFHELGGFDGMRLSGGDAEFCRRARARGIGIRLVAGAIVEHPARAGWDELKTKARRVKGAQLTQGPRRQRLYWLARTCLPPLHEMAFYLCSDHDLGDRVTACGVRLRLWGAELREAVQLLLGRARPERR